MNKDIINGVDVRDCKLIISGGYSFPQCKYYFDSFAPACCQHEDCTYKQMKRATNQYNQVVAQNKDLQTEINGYKTIIEKVRQEVQEDATCESRECGCDSYEECIECLKNTILNIIDEVLNG